MKDTKELDSGNHDTENYYHHFKDLSWESPTVQTGQIAGDCVDINTENPTVANYLNDVITTISTWVLTLSDLILKSTFQDLHLTSITSRHGSRQAVKTSSSLVRFCTRVSEFWNHNIPAIFSSVLYMG